MDRTEEVIMNKLFKFEENERVMFIAEEFQEKQLKGFRGTVTSRSTSPEYGGLYRIVFENYYPNNRELYWWCPGDMLKSIHNVFEGKKTKIKV